MRRRWSEAMESALYGVAGFYRRGNAPAEHFRTSVHASPQFAEAVGRLAVAVDRLLGHPPVFQVVDVGAGSGELLSDLLQCLPESVSERTQLMAVEVRHRPSALAERIAWTDSVPDDITGLLIANEWLDNIPVDVVTRRADGELIYVLVDPLDGSQHPGSHTTREDAEWIKRWWPMDHNEREQVAEVGRQRDRAWRDAVSRLSRGAALAVDYSHERAERAAGRYPHGTLTGFRNGHSVPPVPDGSCDITAHVALDACQVAGQRAGANASLLTTQRAALHALGLHGRRPPIELASTDPDTYLQALTEASEAGELLDPQGLGRFGWLLQAKGTELPAVFRSLDAATTR